MPRPPRSVRYRLVVACIVAATTLVSSCAAMPDDPVGAELRAHARSEFLDELWAPIAVEYPEAIRPDITIGRTIPNRYWLAAVGGCFEANGFTVKVRDGELQYSTGGQTPLEFAVQSYVCKAQHPAESQVLGHLGAGTVGELFGYYVEVLGPCLAAAGRPPRPSPDRRDFVRSYYTGIGYWEPYAAVWSAGDRDEVVAFLEARCPPVPTWLHLG